MSGKVNGDSLDRDFFSLIFLAKKLLDYSLIAYILFIK